MMMVATFAVAFGAWAATWTDPDTGYMWTYQINGDTAEVYKNSYSAAISPKPTGAVTIPSTLGGKPVTSIGNSAFYGCSGLTSVTIPDSVTNIGDRAFWGCSGLTSVTMPGWFEGTLSDDVFEGCPTGMHTEYNIFVISFNANGGSVEATSRLIVRGNAIGTLPTPTRIGRRLWWTAFLSGAAQSRRRKKGSGL